MLMTTNTCRGHSQNKNTFCRLPYLITNSNVWFFLFVFEENTQIDEFIYRITTLCQDKSLNKHIHTFSKHQQQQTKTAKQF